MRGCGIVLGQFVDTTGQFVDTAGTKNRHSRDSLSTGSGYRQSVFSIYGRLFWPSGCFFFLRREGDLGGEISAFTVTESLEIEKLTIKPVSL